MAESETRNAPRKEGQEMKVITKAKELSVHTFKLTKKTAPVGAVNLRRIQECRRVGSRVVGRVCPNTP